MIGIISLTFLNYLSVLKYLFCYTSQIIVNSHLDKEKAGLPTDDIVGVILAAIKPLLPTPQRIIFD